MRHQQTKRMCSGDRPDGVIREDVTGYICLVSGVTPHACDVFFALVGLPFFFYPRKVICT